MNIADIQSKLAGHPTNMAINLPVQDIQELVAAALLTNTLTGKNTETEVSLKGAWAALAKKDEEIKYLQGLVTNLNGQIAALKTPSIAKVAPAQPLSASLKH